MGDSGGGSGDLNVYKIVDSKDCPCRLSDGNRMFVFENLTRGCLYHMLAKICLHFVCI